MVYIYIAASNQFSAWWANALTIPLPKQSKVLFRFAHVLLSYLESKLNQLPGEPSNPYLEFKGGGG